MDRLEESGAIGSALATHMHVQRTRRDPQGMPPPGARRDGAKQTLEPAGVVQPPTQSRCLPPATVRSDGCTADGESPLLRRPTGAGRSKAKAAPQDARWQVHVRTVLHQRLNDFEIRLGCRRRQRRISRAANDVDGVGSCTEQQFDDAKVPADGSVPDNGSQAETQKSSVQPNFSGRAALQDTR